MEQTNGTLPPLVILAGPTASGKSDTAVRLAEKIGGEIISADSMQVYRGMDIGTAKISEEKREGIRHYLIDVADPKEPFDVVRFQTLAKKAASEILAKGKIPILTGGTGFYIQAVLYDIDFTETGNDPAYQADLEKILKEEGEDALFRMLLACDPESAEKIHPHNVRRVMRALTFYHETGKPISRHNREQKEKTAPWHYAYFVLTMDRKLLYSRIDDRVDQMMEEGLLEEAAALKAEGLTAEDVSMKGLGYQEMFAVLDGTMSVEDAVALLKENTRHYAKRQLTWFHHTENVTWIDVSDYQFDAEKTADAIAKLCQKEKIGVNINE